MQTLRIKVQDVDIEILQSSGDGTPLVFCHGNSGSAALFGPLFDSDLGRRHRLLAISFPGHGGSQHGPVDGSLYSIPALGNFIGAVVDALKLKDYVLVGHSMGGHALLEAAAQFPGARGLVLISAPPLNPGVMGQVFKPDPSDGALFTSDLDPPAAAALARCFLAAADEAVLSLLTGTILGTDPHFRPALLASLMRGELRDEVAALNAAPWPIALYAGGQDRFLEQAYMDQLPTEKLWRNKVHTLAEYGHALHLEAPREVAALLAEFVQDIQLTR